MYFTTTLWLGLMMVACAIIQLPVAVYFNSNNYDKFNHKDNVLATIVRASLRACRSRFPFTTADAITVAVVWGPGVVVGLGQLPVGGARVFGCELLQVRRLVQFPWRTEPQPWAALRRRG
jgi:hypothetical protein